MMEFNSSFLSFVLSFWFGPCCLYTTRFFCLLFSFFPLTLRCLYFLLKQIDRYTFYLNRQIHFPRTVCKSTWVFMFFFTFVRFLVFLVWSLLSLSFVGFLSTFLFLPLDPSLPLLFTYIDRQLAVFIYGFQEVYLLWTGLLSLLV